MNKLKFFTPVLYLILSNIATFPVHAEFDYFMLQKQSPHFYIQMENQSGKDISMSFQPVLGSITLSPTLENNSPLPAHQKSNKYGVLFEDLDFNDTFNIVFTGQQRCAYNVAFYAPNNPKITISGFGCFGGGYYLNQNTLVLTIVDIH